MGRALLAAAGVRARDPASALVADEESVYVGEVAGVATIGAAGVEVAQEVLAEIISPFSRGSA